MIQNDICSCAPPALLRDSSECLMSKQKSPQLQWAQPGLAVMANCADLSWDAGRPPFPIHRLDMYTSGVVLMAKEASVVQRLHELFRYKQCHCHEPAAPPPPSTSGRQFLHQGLHRTRLFPAWKRLLFLLSSDSMSSAQESSILALPAPPSPRAPLPSPAERQHGTISSMFRSLGAC